jgi:hypothetical protein
LLGVSASDHDPTNLEQQRQDRAEKAKVRKLERQTVTDAVLWLMRHAPGRRIVWTLLDEARVYRSSFSRDPYETAFREGQRDFGLRATKLVHGACPSLYTKMIEECGKSDDGSNGTSSS